MEQSPQLLAADSPDDTVPKQGPAERFNRPRWPVDAVAARISVGELPDGLPHLGAEELSARQRLQS
jgi:hypothetical protein